MKKILLWSLLLIGCPVLAQDAPAPAPSGMSQPDPKAAAIAINDQLTAMYKANETSAAAWDAVDARITGYQKEFGVTPKTTNNVVLLRKTELTIAKKLVPDRFQALVKTLVNDPVPEVSALAQDVQNREMRIASLKTKPLNLQFTAVDGVPVDISTLRGKVVLIDFWATWCGPCVQEVPHVVETYKKLHDKGFEIIGISLDKEKDTLTQFTQAHSMTWPQYFDGLVWQNKISSSYDIHSIPAMWLVDKKGMLVSTDARNDLAGQVEKLLAQP